MKKRILFLVLLAVASISTYAQDKDFDSYLEAGKAEFSKDYLDQNFKVAAANLEKALALEPDNDEALYFLGNAYSRINSMTEGLYSVTNLPLTIKASEKFEAITKKGKKYEGEMLMLSPYSKIMSEWGSLSMTYLYQNKTDSARWACEEGKRRGGFSDYALSIGRNMLDECPQDAILVSYGDLVVFSLLYLQLVEDYRTDVITFTSSMLSLNWYQEMLRVQQPKLDWGMTSKELDLLESAISSSYYATIYYGVDKQFSWRISEKDVFAYYKPDKMLVNLLRANKFEREVLFSAASGSEFQLNLTNNYFENYLLTDRINYDQKKRQELSSFWKMLRRIVSDMELINENNPDEYLFWESTKYRVLEKVSGMLKDGYPYTARQILVWYDDNMYQKYESQYTKPDDFYQYLIGECYRQIEQDKADEVDTPVNE